MQEYITLTRLLQRIRGAVADNFPVPVWVRAEIHELKMHNNGHCYLELVEKGTGRDLFSAKVQAVIWRSRRSIVEAAFYQGTGRRLEVGMTVLVLVRVQYSEVYGMSLSIEDIDPAFTLGEVELARQRTLERLRKEGMLDMNSTLPLSRLPKRFALITSETAAGYGDFMHHLYDNGYGFKFYTRLYQAPMQGPTAPGGIISALDAIMADVEAGEVYDAVLLLRGGGAVADLVCFDDYDLAVNIAQFPLPVMVAVGHERDTHICDMVAARSVKTPTALADLIVNAFVEEDASLTALSDRLRSSVTLRLDGMRQRLEQTARRLGSGMEMRCRLERNRMDMFLMRMRKGVTLRSGNEQNALNILWMRESRVRQARHAGAPCPQGRPRGHAPSRQRLRPPRPPPRRVRRRPHPRRPPRPSPARRLRPLPRRIRESGVGACAVSDFFVNCNDVLNYAEYG